MSKLIILCGPPGSGKSTYAKDLIENDGDHGAATVYINQDKHGKEEHKRLFDEALGLGKNVIVDRMNFNKEQRSRYLLSAKVLGYETEIKVLYVPRQVCYDRVIKREGHETIKANDSATAGKVLDFFFKNWERPEDYEADKVTHIYPEGNKPSAFVVDLDGTLCNIDHRLHHVRGPGKKNWKAFMEGIPNDSVNMWCANIIKAFQYGNPVQLVYCSGRGSEYKEQTVKWLKDNLLYWQCNDFIQENMPVSENLYMRQRNDHRTDWIIKEIILDFELLTRFNILFTIDDRKQVCDMWRRRGITCLHCAEGIF